MSRLGRAPIPIPSGVTVTVDGGSVAVVGPKGTLTRMLRPEVSIKVENEGVVITPNKDSKFASALWGTYASHIKNMMHGVTEGFTRQLVVEGIGYRVELQGNALALSIGFSHPVSMPIPEGLSAAVEKNVITISGIDKELIGAFAARIRAVKKPEPYKGKGIRYAGEVVRRKQGKRAA